MPTSRGGAALLLLAAALAAASVFLSDGSDDGRLFWIGAAAVHGACAALGAALAGVIPWPRPGRAGIVLVAAFAALVGLVALSMVWSIAADRSWDYANRSFSYLALLAVGLFAGALARRAPTAAAAGFAVLVAAAAAWALAGKIAPGIYPDGARIARLRSPVGYWNALALLFSMGMPVALWLADRLTMPRRVRALGAGLLYLLAVSTLLTYSRGGIVVAAIAVGAWLVLSPTRLESLTALAVAVPVAVAVGAWAFTRAGITDDLQPYDVRVEDGWQFGIVLAVGGAAVLALYVLASRWTETRASFVARRAAYAKRAGVGLGILLVAVLLALAFRGGDPKGWLDRQLDEFKNPVAAQVTQDPSRLGSLNSNNRWQWWQTAWGAFRDRPLGGTGAGTFEIVNLGERTSSLTVTEPHNVPLQFLAETGIFGLLLLVAATGGGIAAAAKGLARLDVGERTAGAALAAGMVAFLVHALADKDWDYVAVAGPLFLGLGILVASGAAPGRRSPRLWWPALGAVVLAWAGLWSLAAPYLSNREVDRAYELLGTGAAVDAAKRAHAYDPFALEPLFAESAAYDVIGEEVPGLDTLRRAVKLQPENPSAWYELATYEYRTIGETQYGNAYRHILRAYRLDPYGPAGELKDEIEQKFLELKAAECEAGKC
jgi:hypothetical protein